MSKQIEKIEAELEQVTRDKIGQNEKVSVTAIEFLKEHDETLIYCRSWGRFLMFNGKYYEKLPPDRLQGMIFDFLSKFEIKWDPTPSFLGQVIGFLRLKVARIVDDDELAHNYFAFQNLLLNTDNLVQTNFNPKILCFKFIDVSLPPTQPPIPAFQGYIKSSLVDPDGRTDDKLIFLYQEMLAALFSHHKRSRKIFFLQGGGDNGKSVTTELIVSMFSREAVSSASLQVITSSQFGKQVLVGKIVNVCSEEESQRIRNDTLKTLVTGELTQGERKYENSFTFHNYAKFIFATNDVPQFTSIDYAMRKRIELIPWLRTFTKEEQDPTLDEKLVREIPGIIFWALKGLRRLIENGFVFTQSKTNMEAFEEMVESMGSVQPFITENFVPDDDFTPIRLSSPNGDEVTVYSRYAAWCSNSGYLKLNLKNFGRQLTKVKGIKKIRRAKGMFYCLRPVHMTPDEALDYESTPASRALEQELNTKIPF